MYKRNMHTPFFDGCTKQIKLLKINVKIIFGQILLENAYWHRCVRIKWGMSYGSLHLNWFGSNGTVIIKKMKC